MALDAVTGRTPGAPPPATTASLPARGLSSTRRTVVHPKAARRLPQGPSCDHCGRTQSIRAVFFNRVPKCGSTTLERIIKSQARKRRFHFERSYDYINNSIDAREQRRVVNTVVRISQHQRVRRLAAASPICPARLVCAPRRPLAGAL